MNDKDLRSYEMILRVADFGTEHAALFASTSLANELFAKARAAATQLANQVAQQVSGRTSKQQGSATKASVRSALQSGLDRLRHTARAMAATIPGIDDKFRIPGRLTDQELIGTAEAFIADATPLKNDFIRFAMPATFLADLAELVADFRKALTQQQTGRGRQVMATAGIEDTLAEALAAVRQLNAIVINTFIDDAARLAAWTSAHHVERSPRRKKGPSSASAGKPSATPPQ